MVCCFNEYYIAAENYIFCALQIKLNEQLQLIDIYVYFNCLMFKYIFKLFTIPFLMYICMIYLVIFEFF